MGKEDLFDCLLWAKKTYCLLWAKKTNCLLWAKKTNCLLWAKKTCSTVYCGQRRLTVYCGQGRLTVYCGQRRLTVYCGQRRLTVYCGQRRLTVYCGQHADNVDHHSGIDLFTFFDWFLTLSRVTGYYHTIGYNGKLNFWRHVFSYTCTCFNSVLVSFYSAAMHSVEPGRIESFATTPTQCRDLLTLTCMYYTGSELDSTVTIQRNDTTTNLTMLGFVVHETRNGRDVVVTATKMSAVLIDSGLYICSSVGSSSTEMSMNNVDISKLRPTVLCSYFTECCCWKI